MLKLGNKPGKKKNHCRDEVSSAMPSCDIDCPEYSRFGSGAVGKLETTPIFDLQPYYAIQTDVTCTAASLGAKHNHYHLLKHRHRTSTSITTLAYKSAWQTLLNRVSTAECNWNPKLEGKCQPTVF